MLRLRCPLDDTQYLVGHSSLRTTRFYEWPMKEITRVTARAFGSSNKRDQWAAYKAIIL